MADDVLWVRLTSEQKHAIRVLAAEQDQDMSSFVLSVLEQNTRLSEKIDTLANRVLHIGQNNQSGKKSKVARS